MSIDSDLQVLQNHLNKKLEIETSVVIRLEQSIIEQQSLVIWPWLIENSISQELHSRTVELVQKPPLRSKMHLLVLSNDLNILFQARNVLHNEPVPFIDDTRRLRISFSPLTSEQTCSIFLASGIPMQASLSLILESIVFVTDSETAPPHIESVTY